MIHVSLDDKFDEMQEAQESRKNGRRGFKKPSFGRKGKAKSPQVQHAVQYQVAKPKRQMPQAVKRTYSWFNTLLRVLQPLNAIVVLVIMFVFITVLHGWHLFSIKGVGVGVGLVVVELLLFSQVWKQYKLATPEQSKHLLIMGFFAFLMCAVAVVAYVKLHDHLYSILLVVATVIASVDPMEVANVNAEKRSIRAEIEAELAEIRLAAETNLQSTSIVLQQVNELVPGINDASDKSAEAIKNATSLIGVLTDQEEAVNRRVAAQLASEKPALIMQIRREEEAKAQQKLDQYSEQLRDQYAAQYGQPQPPAQPTSRPTGGLPGYPGAHSAHSSVPASQDTVQGEVSQYD